MTARAPRRLPALLLSGLCAGGVVADILYLGLGAPRLAESFAVGALPGGVTMALDGLSGFFLLIVLVGGAAASVSAKAWTAPRVGLLAAFVFGMIVCLLAGDMVVLVAGFELMSAACLVLLLTGDAGPAPRSAAVRYAGFATVGGVCLIVAAGVLAGPGGWSLDVIRVHPPLGMAAGSVFALVLVGAGSRAGLVPLHVWLPPAHEAAPAAAGALMSGAMTKVALYVMIRVLVDLCGPAQPGAWGAVVMLVGAVSAVLGAARANVETDIKSVLGCSTIANLGLMVVGLGVALAARAADLPALASLALGGALLHALAHGLFKPLLFLAAGAVQDEAGSRELDRLGGLIHRMPVTTACVLVAAASLAALPPSAGFAGEWLVLQSVFTAPRVGGLAFQMASAVVAASLAFAAGLAAAAAVRLVGIGFLGRPRTPRGASAQEVPRSLRAVLLTLAALVAGLGLLPSVGLGLARPGLHLLLGDDLASRAGLLAARAQPDGATYVPLGLAVLLGLAGAVLLGLVRLRARGGVRRVASWDGGFGPPPAWLPFGDPMAQGSAAGQSQVLRRTVGAVLLQAREQASPAAMTWSAADPSEALLFAPLARARDRLSGWAERLLVLTARQALIVLFAVLLALLAAVAVAEQV